MKTDQHQRKPLKDYQPPDFAITDTQLEFHLAPGSTRVRSRLQMQRLAVDPASERVLDGIELKLLEVSVDGRTLAADAYRLDDETLTLTDLPERFEFACEVEIDPEANTRLEGLYLSNGNFCTQCEAEGFRYITYYLDRPDVMCLFTTTVDADRDTEPTWSPA